MEKKVLKVSICDKVYTIATDENEEQIHKAAGMVDALFKDIASKTNFNNDGKIGIFVALQLAFDLSKERTSVNELLGKITTLNSLIEDTE